jgi:hypothetical protein
MYYVIPYACEDHEIDRCEYKTHRLPDAKIRADELEQKLGTHFRIVSVEVVWTTKTLADLIEEDRRAEKEQRT